MEHHALAANPLDALTPSIIAHAIVMTLVCVVLEPWRAALSEERHLRLKKLLLDASAIVVVVLTGVVLFDDHNTPVHNRNASLFSHGVLGTVAALFLVIMLLLHNMSSKPANALYAFADSWYWVFSQMWRGMLVAVALSGFVAVFDLCTLSGTDQCVGHFGPAAAMSALAALYAVLWVVAREYPDTGPHAATHFRLLLVELAVTAFAGVAASLYSIATEAPSDGLAHAQHLAASLVLGAGGSAAFAYTWRRVGAGAKALPAGIERGFVGTAGLALVVGLIFAAHPQHNAYAQLLHRIFGATLFVAGVARFCHAYYAAAVLMGAAAAVFVASQHGFGMLFTQYYAASVSAPTVGSGILAAALVCAAWLVHLVQLRRPRELLPAGWLSDLAIPDPFAERIDALFSE